MVLLVDRQLQQWLNVYVQLVLLVLLAVYVCLSLFFFIVNQVQKLNILDDSCANFPCKNGGSCATLLTDTGTIWSAYRCSCPPGFYGQNCDTGKRNHYENSFFLNIRFSLVISSCASMVCPSYQICSEQPTGPICTCSGSKVGTFCQYGKIKTQTSVKKSISIFFLFR